MGVKLISDPAISLHEIFIEQWFPYNTENKNIPAREALSALLHKMEETHQHRLFAKTALLIAPGYTIKIPNALITNFHQPQSTLLLLVAAFAGKNWKSIYHYALENNFRFLSYGDGCLILR
jgi:S-adenosylmethionine:tRNA ribosyltransferase-isomerase